MLFEGPEKKLEIVVADSCNLKECSREFWDQVVQLAQAQILSVISDSECDAYLLSESSLFVWKDRLTMITCGRTRLDQAAEFLIAHFGEEQIDEVFYQRKNENFPHLQQTSFFQDSQVINARFSGRSYRFGEPSSHHMYLFYSDRKADPHPTDVTFEVLMYGLQGRAKDIFFGQKLTEAQILESQVRQLLPDFQIDDYAFEPCGYSLNALKNGSYFTVHVTPQEQGSYVSFETNAVKPSEFNKVLSRLLKVFQPDSFDVITFEPRLTREQPIQSDSYVQQRFVSRDLSGGYSVHFYHFYEPRLAETEAVDITEEIVNVR